MIKRVAVSDNTYWTVERVEKGRHEKSSDISFFRSRVFTCQFEFQYINF